MAIHIIDASVVIEYLVSGPYTNEARTLFGNLTLADRLIVPEFCLLECTNVLWKHVRFQGMPVPQAKALLRHLKKLPLSRVPVKATLDAALSIAVTHQLAVYDSAYVALARRSGYPLITIDQAQSRVAGLEGVILKAITDFLPRGSGPQT
jgi:predicted nucleic acid-binding protein